MADKEPRRRKKRRDSQKKDDVRQTEEQFFASLKSESRESDQEIEEEPVSYSHHGQPSNLAKVVFVILFSGLVVSLSVIFISLRDVDKGPVDIFASDHHGDHHGEELHDEHLEGVLHDEHHHDQGNEVTIDDFIPGLSSIFSLNNEVLQEVESPEIPSKEEDEVDDARSHDVESENSVDQGILEEYVEDLSAVGIEEPLIEEPLSSEAHPETTTSGSQAEDIYSAVDYSESEDGPPTLQPDKNELSLEHLNSDELEEISQIENPVDEPVEMSPILSSVDESEEILSTESSVDVQEVLPTTDVEQDTFSLYEKADITNEFDYEIQDDLDELDDIVIKDSDNYIDDVGDENEVDHHIDEEEIEEEEGVEEEFDFWQF